MVVTQSLLSINFTITVNKNICQCCFFSNKYADTKGFTMKLNSNKLH